MSKFFDAAQRATGVKSAPNIKYLGKQNQSVLQEKAYESVEEGNEDFLITVKVRRDDEIDQDDVLGQDEDLDEAFDSLLGNTDEVASAEQVATITNHREAPLDEEEEGSDARQSPSPITTGSALLEKPLHPAYERIIHRLLAFRSTARTSVVLLASPAPREGVSTIARNTATALARHRTERILLVDANLRAPVQHAAFNIDRANGLSDVILGSISLTSAVKHDVSPGLSLLTAGKPIDSPSRVLTQSVSQSLVMALTSLFDWVIIDGPPVTAFPESASLAAASGGALLVVRAEQTRQEVAEEARRVLEDSGTEVLGAVLNRRKYHIPGFIYRRL